MPVKWTPEADQILLLKIIETSKVNADYKAIAEAWPAELERPTARAISERLFKIRAAAAAVKTSEGNGVATTVAMNGEGKEADKGRKEKMGREGQNGAAKEASATLGKRKRNAKLKSDSPLSSPGSDAPLAKTAKQRMFPGLTNVVIEEPTKKRKIPAAEQTSKTEPKASVKPEPESNGNDHLGEGV